MCGDGKWRNRSERLLVMPSAPNLRCPLCGRTRLFPGTKRTRYLRRSQTRLQWRVAGLPLGACVKEASPSPWAAPFGFKADAKPSGWRISRRNLCIREDEAIIIRAIFRMYILGKNETLIAESLNSRGQRMRDAPFTAKIIQNILDNTLYAGSYYFEENTEELCSQRAGRNSITDNLRIVDRETFCRVQRLRRIRIADRLE